MVDPCSCATQVKSVASASTNVTLFGRLKEGPLSGLVENAVRDSMGELAKQGTVARDDVRKLGQV